VTAAPTWGPVAVLRFEVEGKPQAWQRTGGAGRRRFKPQATRDYEALVGRRGALAASEAGLPARPADGSGRRLAYFLGPVGLVVRVFWADRRRRDVDNVAKAVMDAIQLGRGPGVALLADDSQVTDLRVVKGVDRERPRIEVEVREIEG
jgi:hypothetical protein